MSSQRLTADDKKDRKEAKVSEQEMAEIKSTHKISYKKDYPIQRIIFSSDGAEAELTVIPHRDKKSDFDLKEVEHFYSKNQLSFEKKITVNLIMTSSGISSKRLKEITNLLKSWPNVRGLVLHGWEAQRDYKGKPLTHGQQFKDAGDQEELKAMFAIIADSNIERLKTNGLIAMTPAMLQRLAFAKNLKNLEIQYLDVEYVPSLNEFATITSLKTLILEEINFFSFGKVMQHLKCLLSQLGGNITHLLISTHELCLLDPKWHKIKESEREKFLHDLINLFLPHAPMAFQLVSTRGMRAVVFSDQDPLYQTALKNRTAAMLTSTSASSSGVDSKSAAVVNSTMTASVRKM